MSVWSLNENSKKKKKKKKKKFLEIGNFFSNWEKGHLNSIGKGAEFRPQGTPKKSLDTDQTVNVLFYGGHCVKLG